MTTRTGLIIGKFYPPHLGHLSLIERAAREVDHLVVLVMATQMETVPLERRVAWMTASTEHLTFVTVLGILDDAPVHYDSEIAWIAHHEVTLAALRRGGIHTIDVVFSSESYGAELAKRLGAEHVLDDPERRRVPMSGTAARENLAERWSKLVAAARLDLATRIVVIGAESTGTTTLAEALRGHYRTRPGLETIADVDEYGRRFTYELHERASAAAQASGSPRPDVDDLVWLPEHFAHIAREQTRMEQAAALECSLVIADTDAFATSLWERRYVGEHSSQSLEAATIELPRRDLYLITDHIDVPFDQDGWRDGEHIRPEMTKWIIDGLTARGLPWVLLRGPHRARLDYSIEVIDALIERNSTFVSPAWADVTRLAGDEPR
jgi:HTH-type transcriptional repressor of NAD biosynthesis genes